MRPSRSVHGQTCLAVAFGQTSARCRFRQVRTSSPAGSSHQRRRLAARFRLFPDRGLRRDYAHIFGPAAIDIAHRRRARPRPQINNRACLSVEVHHRSSHAIQAPSARRSDTIPSHSRLRTTSALLTYTRLTERALILPLTMRIHHYAAEGFSISGTTNACGDEAAYA